MGAAEGLQSVAPSPLHFTYEAPTSPSLCQGDILKRMLDGLDRVLEDVHPHYLKDDYRFFIVLTQSCDLELRDGETCSARYLTIAAVRPLDIAIQRELQKYQSSQFALRANVCRSSARTKLAQFIERLLNNNESKYFYLHECPQRELDECVCAFLHLSIALKAEKHYKTCLAARILSLREVFRAKLGESVGRLYSRVGTEDWVPKHRNRKEFTEQIEQVVDQACQWVDDKRLTKARKEIERQNVSVEKASSEELRKIIDQIDIPDRKQIAIERARAVLRDYELIQDPASLERFEKALKMDPEFASIFK